MDFSRDNNREGKNNKLDNTASNKVMETNIPNACVPPKFENINMPNPAKRTLEE
jgi:hypothetical protein